MAYFLDESLGHLSHSFSSIINTIDGGLAVSGYWRNPDNKNDLRALIVKYGEIPDYIDPTINLNDFPAYVGTNDIISIVGQRQTTKTD